jgi:acyl-CoA synthetase (NDP forming)
MTLHSDLEKAFNPEAVAVVGVSSREKPFHPGYTGLRFLRLLRSSGFRGRVYPINPKLDELEGAKAYPSLLSVPEPLDLVIITVPAASVPGVLEDCAKAGARNVHICTSGFDETGEVEGGMLQERLREIALTAGLRATGPNCMGYHVPSVGLNMYEGVPLLPGPVAFVSQSGSYGMYLVRQFASVGIGVSKFISYGNATVMDATDYLEYLATDAETRVICMYLESIKDGRKLTKLVSQISPAKPVIIWKGGVTESGSRAVTTHTGTLAGDAQVWDAFFRQTGAIRVASLEEIVDVTMTLLRLKPGSGRRVAVLGNAGGGTNVARGDICAEEGLEMPMLSQETVTELLEFIPLINQSVMNPMDVPGVLIDGPQLVRTISLLSADPLIDFIIIHLSDNFFDLWEAHGVSTEFMSRVEECMSRFADSSWSGKPVVLAMQNLDRYRNATGFAGHMKDTGIIIYGSLGRACRALNRFARYHEFIAENNRSPMPA